MITDLVDSATLIVAGAIVWAGVLGGAAAFVLLVLIVAGIPLGAWAVKRARTVRRPSWARGGIRAWVIARARRRPAGRSAPDEYREAA
ncbi:hypothetical protein ACFY3G_02850 [Streptomyces phaeochromogenes]|uniref:hypothetical protein n=1 Tax=Streptomyces phaeochromogenes TaxID=1923 RepID=UPI0036AD7D4C